MNLAEYDFGPERLRQFKWMQAQQVGAKQLYVNSHICALLTGEIKATTNTYEWRLKGLRTTGRFKDFHTVEDVMALDMNYIGGAVWTTDKEGGWPVQLYTNDLEDVRWLDLLKRCPFAYKIAEYKSRMGEYKIQEWILAQKDPRVSE